MHSTASSRASSSKYPEFCYALLEGKDAFDDRIERSLARRGAGYSVHIEKLYCSEGQIIRAQTVERYPPEVGAIKLRLGNRRLDDLNSTARMPSWSAGEQSPRDRLEVGCAIKLYATIDQYYTGAFLRGDYQVLTFLIWLTGNSHQNP